MDVPHSFFQLWHGFWVGADGVLGEGHVGHSMIPATRHSPWFGLIPGTKYLTVIPSTDIKEWDKNYNAPFFFRGKYSPGTRVNVWLHSKYMPCALLNTPPLYCRRCMVEFQALVELALALLCVSVDT